jgi:hypothetical protein
MKMKYYIAIKKENGKEFLAFRFGKVLFIVDSACAGGYSGHFWLRSRIFELRQYCRI